MDVEKYLNSFFKGTKDPSLDAMKYFMETYKNFEKKMNFIHIAGTNGKGSCTETITNILMCQGYKVGKFISPHLIKYNERISINGKNILDEELAELIEELKPEIEKYEKENNIKITLFELETTMALLYFFRNNVDFVVLETGLGGLYDCTNIISKPLVSLITSIGYDHMQILGNTLTEIAYQKAGIIKPNSNTVFFEQSQNINKVFEDKCKKKNNKLYLVKENEISNYRYDKDYQYFDYKNLKNIKVKLKGIKQINNTSICIEAMKILNKLGYEVSEENIRKGIETVIHKGRMEELNKNPLIIFDGAHNEPAIVNLKQTIEMYYKEKQKKYIISILKSKDHEKILSILLDENHENSTFILTSGNDQERYNSKEELYKVALKYKKANQKIYMKELEEAIEEIREDKNKDSVNFIVGSFYVYGNVINKLKSM